MNQPAARRPSRNREKLLETTVELMNLQGCNVGTAQIAEHCGVSPGNLYYHFRNREEILREIFGRLESDLDAVLSSDPDAHIDAARFASFYTGGASVLWKYRFIFASATEFIFRDPQLASEYRDFTEHSIRQMERIITRVTAQHAGNQRPSAERIRAIAENKWVLWIAWPRYAELRSGEASIKESDIALGLEQIFGLLEPYLNEAFCRETGAAIHAFVEQLQRDVSL